MRHAYDKFFFKFFWYIKKMKGLFKKFSFFFTRNIVIISMVTCFLTGFASAQSPDYDKSGPWSEILENWIVSQTDNSNASRQPKMMTLGGQTLSVTSKILPTTRRDVSETDLYLLGAIEKLVYRVDHLEKRLRRAEELLYYVIAGNNKAKDSCAANYTKIGQNCYHFSNREYDWKSAGSLCRGMGGNLAEFEESKEKNEVINYIQKDQNFRNKSIWIGGLNPGLLWIWAGSAKPVQKDPNHTIPGNGRCLKLSYNKEMKNMNYKGEDCGLRHRYICKMTMDDESANKIERTARKLLTDYSTS